MKNLFGITKVLFATLLCLAFTFDIDELQGAANTAGYDTTRIYHAMAKARRGEPIKIGVIGGSITAGSLASSEATRWANLVTDWWETTFPTSTVTLINAGIGGTGSDLGTHRLNRDLLNLDPDFIVVEFSVNDSEGEYAEKMMEGLIRQSLTTDSLPGVMILMLRQRDGTTAQVSHKLVGNHYAVPMISFADMIDTAVSNDGYDLGEIFGDAAEPNYGLHPNDLGMAYIAEFITAELNLIYSNLPNDEDLGVINTALPAPLITDTYGHTYIYGTPTLIPVLSNGWTITAGMWTSDIPGSQMDFLLDGNAISFTYRRHNDDNRGQIEAWVDDGPHQIYDAYWTETWGPGTRFALVQEGLADGSHTLHVKVLNTNSTGTDGHYFEIVNVCKAGDWLTAAPIANAGANIKVFTGTPVILDGSTSSDPDNDTIQTYSWSVVSAPITSTAEIAEPSDTITEFTPDVEGRYHIGLVVNDGFVNSVMDIKTINARLTNNAPVANAGEDRDIPLRVWCFPSGSASTDADHDSLTFLWRKISEPEGSNVRLYNETTRVAKFMPTKTGDYTLGLLVNDSLESSEEDVLILTVVEPVGIQEINVDGYQLKSFPNPVSDILYIQYYVPSAQKISFALLSVDGKKLELKNVFCEPGEYNLEMNIRNNGFYQGTYILQMITGNEVIQQTISVL